MPFNRLMYGCLWQPISNGMNVLMISTDVQIFEKGSEVRRRMELYRTRFHELHIVVYTTHTIPAFNEGNLFCYATASRSRISFFKDAYRLGAQVMKRKGEWV